MGNGTRVTCEPAPSGGITMTTENHEAAIVAPLTRQEALGVVADILVAAGVQRASFETPALRAI